MKNTSTNPALSLIKGTTSRPEPPRKFGVHGRALWDAIQSTHQVDDVGGIELLAQACATQDRVEALRKAIDSDGEVIQGPSGVRAHPGLRDELQGRMFIVRCIERLGLNVEAVKPMGRPPKSFGWKGNEDADQ